MRLCPGFSVSDSLDFAKAVGRISTLIGHKVRFPKKSDTQNEVGFVSDLMKKSVQRRGLIGVSFCAAKVVRIWLRETQDTKKIGHRKRHDEKCLYFELRAFSIFSRRALISAFSCMILVLSCLSSAFSASSDLILASVSALSAFTEASSRSMPRTLL